MEAVNQWTFKVTSDLVSGAEAEQHRGCYGSFGSVTLGRAFGGTWGSAFVIERVAKMHKGVGVGRETGAGTVDATINNVLQSNYRVIGCRVRGANACKLTFCGVWMWEEPQSRSLCLSRDNVRCKQFDRSSCQTFPILSRVYILCAFFSF